MNLREKLGEIVEIRVKREYGPYLDNRPILQPGRYRAILMGVETYGGKPTSYKVSHCGHEYYIQAIDADYVE